MVNLEQLQTIAQLVDNIEISVEKLEKAYENNDSEEFSKSKNTILDFQKKISEMLK